MEIKEIKPLGEASGNQGVGDHVAWEEIIKIMEGFF